VRVRGDSGRIVRSTRVIKLVLVATSLAVFGSLIATPGTAWAVPVPWRNCGSAGDPISIQKFDASVWPPQAGKPLTLSAAWTSAETLSKQSREVVNTTPVFSGPPHTRLHFESPVAALFENDLFEQVSGPQMSSPIQEGPYNQTFTMNVLPENTVPSEPLEVDMVGFDGSGRQIVCMQLTIPIK
jgi:hypothetical protein